MSSLSSISGSAMSSSAYAVEDMKSRLSDAKEKNAQKTAQEFNTMFLKFFLTKIMPEMPDGYFGGSTNEIYQGLWIDALAEDLAKNDPLGLEKLARKHLKLEGEVPAYATPTLQERGPLHDIVV